MSPTARSTIISFPTTRYQSVRVELRLHISLAPLLNKTHIMSDLKVKTEEYLRSINSHQRRKVTSSSNSHSIWHITDSTHTNANTLVQRHLHLFHCNTIAALSLACMAACRNVSVDAVKFQYSTQKQQRYLFDR